MLRLSMDSGRCWQEARGFRGLLPVTTGIVDMTSYEIELSFLSLIVLQPFFTTETVVGV